MCLLLLAYEPQNNNRLIVLSNRDEFYARSTEPAHYWSAQEVQQATTTRRDEEQDVSTNDDENDAKPQALSITILAGRDAVGGGTWLGVDPKRNRFAAVTNFREGLHSCRPSVIMNKKKTNQSSSNHRKRSRGSLPVDFLTSDMDSMTFLRQAHLINRLAYDGFNLLVYDGTTLAYLSNRQKDVGPKELSGGIYGLCNGLLDDPWPKVVEGKDRLQAKLEEHRSSSTNAVPDESLLNIMLDTDRPLDDDKLPNTGVPMELERGYSSIFVDMKSIGYGTRSSAMVIMYEDGVQLFVERTYERDDGGGGRWDESEDGGGCRKKVHAVAFGNFAT